MLTNKKLLTFLGVFALLLAVTTSQVLAAGTITLSKTYGLPGTVMTVSGSGFAATETVSIKFDTTTIGSATTSSGAFSASVTIPSTATPGTHSIIATGATSGYIASAAFKVLAPNLTISPTSGLPGVVISVSGTQFGASEIVTIKLSTTILGTATASSTGAFTASVTIPASTAPATYTISATGGTTGIEALGKFTVLNPNVLTLSKSYGPPGTVLTVSGSGYAATETVTIKLGTVTLGTATTASGAFSTSVTVPVSMIPGSYTMTGTGGTSGHVDSAAFKVTYPPLTLNPTSGTAGTSVSVSGIDFAAAEVVTLTFDTTTVGTVTTSSTGTFTKSITVPSSAAVGSHTITATGGTSKIVESGKYSVLAINSLSISPTSALPGAVITVSGAGYNATETVTIKLGSTTIGTATTSSGAFSVSVTIPLTMVPGTYTMTGTGATSGHVDSASFTVNAPITLTLSKTYGLPGTIITVSGSGYAAAESVVIKLGSTQIGTATTVSGAFSASVTIPLTTLPGTYSITATGVTSGHVDQAPFKVLAPTLVLNPSSGLPGTVTTVSGSEFAAGETITIKLGSTTLGTTTATSTGTFSTSVTIPSTLAIGTYTISATGGTSKIEALGKFSVN